MAVIDVPIYFAGGLISAVFRQASMLQQVLFSCQLYRAQHRSPRGLLRQHQRWRFLQSRLDEINAQAQTEAAMRRRGRR